MNIVTGKQESVYDLIRSMSKAEKRNFKLYATRLSGNQEAKFISLFDCMDALDEYDETKILQRCPIKKEQLPNMKAHLYKQILVSIRLLDAQRTVPIQLREQIDFARILYDKGLFRQSTKILEKAKEQALFYEQYTQAIEIIEFQKRLGTLSVSRGLVAKSETVSRQVAELCTRIKNINELSNSGSQLYGLYLQLGYARTQKDLDMIVQVYGPTLAKYDDERQLSFTEKVYLYQAQVWYNYIRHDMLTCYKYVCRWILLFDSAPHMKELMYDLYLRGYSRLLDGLYLLRSRSFTSTASTSISGKAHSRKASGRSRKWSGISATTGPSWISTTGWCFATKSPASISDTATTASAWTTSEGSSARAIRASTAICNATPAS